MEQLGRAKSVKDVYKRQVVPRPLPCWEMVWTSVILHPAEVFTGGSPKKTEGSSANMNQVPKAGHIIFRQGTGSVSYTHLDVYKRQGVYHHGECP